MRWQLSCFNGQLRNPRGQKENDITLYIETNIFKSSLRKVSSTKLEKKKDVLHTLTAQEFRETRV